MTWAPKAAVEIEKACKKVLQNTGFAGCRQCIRASGPTGSLARLKPTAFSTVLRRFSSAIARGDRGGLVAARPASALRAPGRASGADLAGERARGEADDSGRRAARRSRCPRWASSKAQTESAVLTWSVPSRAIREGQAFRAIASPTASGQRSTISARSPEGPKRRELAADRVRQPFHGSPPRCRLGLGRQQAERMRRGDHGLAEPRDRGGQRLAAAQVELREHVVEKQERRRRRAARPRRGGARGRRAAARPASRIRAARGRRRSRGRRDAARAPSSRARRRRRGGPRGPPRRAGRPRRRAARPAARSRRGAPGTPARERDAASRRASTSCCAERGDALRPRRDDVPRRRGRAARGGALRSAARAPPRSPAGDRSRAGAGRARARSRYARRTAGPPLTTASRSGVKTSVGNSRRSDSADGRRVPSSSADLARAGGELHPHPVVGRRRARPRARPTRPARPSRIIRASLRVRGEKPWVPDVDRLEQVRLAGAVLARHEHDARQAARARATRSCGSS